MHFHSKAIRKHNPFGPAWHLLYPSGSGLIAQDGVDTFTIHLGIHDMNKDLTKLDLREVVYEALGGTLSLFRFEIDEILVHSAWRMNFAIADKYMTDGGRVILAGDAGKYSRHLLACDVVDFQTLSSPSSSPTCWLRRTPPPLVLQSRGSSKHDVSS